MSLRVANSPVPRLGSTVTASEDTTTGATINQLLLGGLHDFTFGNNAARTHADGVVKVRRTDKILTCTPMKAGAPDATRPTAGVSGSYSYDWQVLDRFLDECIEDGTTPYISLDACPQLLGGSVAPYSGTALTTWKPSGSSFPNTVPNDFAAFAVMCVDVVHHCTVTKGVSVPYWGLWNEPAASGFWAGTSAQYFDLYEQVATAIKAFNPALKVGGPEDAQGVGSTFDAWTKGLMSYCLTNEVPLDFLSHHEFSATGRVLSEFVAKVERAKTEIGWTDPLEFICGEWTACNQANFPLNTSPFGTRTKLTINDLGAAITALTLMELQRLGYALATFANPASELTQDGYYSSGLFSEAGPWATGNVYRLWDRMGAASVVSSAVEGDPGIHAIAAKRAGTLYVLIASTHWRQGREFPVTVALPDTDNGRVTTLTVIDKDHSNQYDAGLPNAELQTVPVADVAGGQVRLSVQARSVVLLEIAP